MSLVGLEDSLVVNHKVRMLTNIFLMNDIYTLFSSMKWNRPHFQINISKYLELS